MEHPLNETKYKQHCGLSHMTAILGQNFQNQWFNEPGFGYVAL